MARVRIYFWDISATPTGSFLCPIQNVQTWCLFSVIPSAFSIICFESLKHGCSMGPKNKIDYKYFPSVYKIKFK